MTKPLRVPYLARTKVPKRPDFREVKPVKVAYLGRLKKPKVRRMAEVEFL